ncbi:hypothetical protein BZA77DRAFT_295377 [Pyronema omphalodes]|nr:hypothetical protein BZA77DRAFT_295377 [Pyronema omphalodes]
MTSASKISVLKPTSGNQPRIETSEKSTTTRITRHSKGNTVTHASLSKRKVDAKVNAPISSRVTKRRRYDEEQEALPSRVTRRKIDNNDQATASLSRPVKHTSSNFLIGLADPLAYQERLAKAGRSWADLEKAAASKDWNTVRKLSGSATGMSGGLIVGEKFKVPKPYNFLIKKIRKEKGY